MRETEASQLAMVQLLEKAVNNSADGMTISDIRREDQPLIYLNEGFERLTGYSREEVIGKNCRFLQGERTNRTSVDRIRQAIINEDSCTVELLNYRKDGQPFWNRLAIAPIRDLGGNVTHYVGIQSDITELKETRDRLQKANEELEQFRHRITKELEQARLAQAFLLPTPLPSPPHLRFVSKFTPMQEIGGDFFDVVEIRSGIYGVLIADVTGHGIPAALITFMSSTTFKNSAPLSLSPAETLAMVNNKLFQQMPGDAFVTMFYATYDSRSGTLRYCQAGHPPAYVIRSSSREMIELVTGDPFIGILAKDEVTFSEGTLDLVPGDKVLLYTDAITDILDKGSSRHDQHWMKQVLAGRWDLPLQDLVEEIYGFGLRQHAAEVYPDDFTMVGFEVL